MLHSRTKVRQIFEFFYLRQLSVAILLKTIFCFSLLGEQLASDFLSWFSIKIVLTVVKANVLFWWGKFLHLKFLNLNWEWFVIILLLQHWIRVSARSWKTSKASSHGICWRKRGSDKLFFFYLLLVWKGQLRVIFLFQTKSTMHGVTVAFEVTVDDELVHSKKENGSILEFLDRLMYIVVKRNFVKIVVFIKAKL